MRTRRRRQHDREVREQAKAKQMSRRADKVYIFVFDTHTQESDTREHFNQSLG